MSGCQAGAHSAQSLPLETLHQSARSRSTSTLGPGGLSAPRGPPARTPPPAPQRAPRGPRPPPALPSPNEGREGAGGAGVRGGAATLPLRSSPLPAPRRRACASRAAAHPGSRRPGPVLGRHEAAGPRSPGPSAAPAGTPDPRRRAPPGRNPFVHELRLGALQKAQVALMSLTVFPVRLLLAVLMMLLAWPLAFVASLGPEDQEPEQPEAWWRRLVDVLLRALMRAMWFAGGFHRVVVKGQRAPPSEAAILTLAPHSSYFDAIPVTTTMSSIVMKAESRDIPVWGTLIRYIRPVFVSRSDQDSRRKTVEEIRRRAESGGRWPQMMIFPEGTCTNRSCLITFKPGAFIPGVPVQPVVLRYPNKLDTITWTWQGPGALHILWLTLCQVHSRVEIEFLPVYTPSEHEKRDPTLYASNVRRVMAEALGVPVTDCTFEDCQLALAGGPLRPPADTCLLEFARLVRRLGLKPEKLEPELDRLSEVARRQGPGLDLPGFAAFLDMPVSDPLEDIFCLFDEAGRGKMDPREYVVALSVICRPAQPLSTMQLAFQMFGAPDGSLEEEALAVILAAALGVAWLSVSRVFRAMDAAQRGRVCFADFSRFLELHPDFAEEFLCPQKLGLEGHEREPPVPTPNGFCTDFSPEGAEGDREPLWKKLD